MLIRAYRLEIQSVMLVFSTQLCELLPLWPSLLFKSLPASLCQSTVHTNIVWLGGGGGRECLVLLDTVFCRSLINSLYLTRFRTYKIARQPQTKPRRGGDLRQINICRKVPSQVNFFLWRHFALASMSFIFLLLKSTTSQFKSLNCFS